VQSVDLIITDIPWLITMDPGRRVIRDAAVAVDGGKIIAVGKSGDIKARYTGKNSVDGRDTVATPGFVDCHLHSSFQLSRGLADEANAQSFLFDRMYPYEAALDGDDVRVSATLAATELLRHGVTCFIDPGNYHPEASVEGVMATGNPDDRVALLVRSDQVGARHSARAHDREHRRRHRACRGGARTLCRFRSQVRKSAAWRQRLVPRPQQRLRRAHHWPQEACRPLWHIAADPRVLFLFDPTIQASPAPDWPRSSGWRRLASSTNAC